MSIFNGKDGLVKPVKEFVEEKHLQSVDRDYDDALRNIVFNRKLSSKAPILDRQSQYLTQYYQEMIDQNYIIMRQNQEIINLLKEKGENK